MTARNISIDADARVARVARRCGIGIFASAWLLAAGAAGADIRLPRLVGDNMVLQRDAPLKLWGWADPGERIQMRFRNQLRRTTADAGGAWSVTLAAVSAGGPYQMQLIGKHAVTLHNILVGDVWLASGQSNMEFPLRRQGGFGGVNNAEHEVSGAYFPRLRLLLVNKETALKPKSDVTSQGWQAVIPATAANFSAVAYLFGRELQQRYRVPIGLIESSWGGTPAESWTSDLGLQRLPYFAASIERRSLIDARALADYDQYLASRNDWYRLHGREDRGRVDGQDLWAAAPYQAIDWPTTTEPQPWPLKTTKDFDGTMWYRKTLDIPESLAGSPLRLHLTSLLQADTTYFNGSRVGTTTGEIAERDYPVPAQLVQPGSNVITVRISGEYASGDGYVGMLGEAADLYAQIGSETLPLAGTWSYQAGPDVTALPDPPPLAEFMSRYPQAPALLYNAMIAPLTGYRIKGVIWYQGEANANRAVQYRVLFPAMIRDWRSHWGYEFPFLFVQLAGFGRQKPQPADYPWAELREAQAAALALPHTGMAVAIDIGNASDIHPKNKQDVAHRLVLAAELAAYSEHIVPSGPSYRSMQIEGNRIRLNFAGIGSGLELKDPRDGVRGFSIAGDDAHFVWARARLEGNEVLVSADAVSAPVAVRYDWGNTPDGNLYNREGLPAAPFRTDAPRH